MEKDDIKTLIKRLIDEANVIAPSISHFEDKSWGGQILGSGHAAVLGDRKKP